LKRPPTPTDAVPRLVALRAPSTLDAASEDRFDRITRLVCTTLDIPIALIMLSEAEGPWVKSCRGLDQSEIRLDEPLIAETLHGGDILTVPDATRDSRFRESSLVAGAPGVRFYAGVPLGGASGQPIGILAALDRRPRQLSFPERQALEDLARWAENESCSLDDEDSRTQLEQHASQLRGQAPMLDLVHDAVISRDQSGIVRFWSRGAEELYGWSSAEAIGRGIHELLHPRLSQSQREVDEILARDGAWEGNLMQTRRDGSVVLVESRWVVQRSADGRPMILESDKDVTEHREVEQQLQDSLKALANQYFEGERSRSETRAVLDAASDAIALVTYDRRFVNVNRSFTTLFGVPPELVLGRRFDELLSYVDQVFAEPAEFLQVVAGTSSDKSRQFSHDFDQRWPEYRQLALFSTPVPNLGRLYVFRDVTRERESEQMRSDIVSLLSRDLKVPLISIKGHVNLLLSGEAGELTDGQRGFLDVVKSDADDLVSVVNDMLEISQMEAGTVALNWQAVDLHAVIDPVVSAFSGEVQARQQFLQLQIPEDLPTVSGDPDRIAQILTNLLSTAYKRTPPGGCITVRAAAEGHQVTIEVEDSGLGLGDGERSHPSERFLAPDLQTADERVSAGLGLAITRSLVQMHGGDLRSTTRLGEGSTFSFRLSIATLVPVD